jgi:hypothetical protein
MEITFHTGNGHGGRAIFVEYPSCGHPDRTSTAEPPHRVGGSGKIAFQAQPQRFYGGMAAASWSRLPWSSQTFQGNPRIAEGPATFPAATHSG